MGLAAILNAANWAHARNKLHLVTSYVKKYKYVFLCLKKHKNKLTTCLKHSFSLIASKHLHLIAK